MVYLDTVKFYLEYGIVKGSVILVAQYVNCNSSCHEIPF